MELLALLCTLALAALVVKHQQERRRIALLASCLQPLQVEKLMETLSNGYLRALGESEPERQRQIWSLLGESETLLCSQLAELARRFAKVDAAQSRVSRIPVGLPWADTLFAGASFDMRTLLALHARRFQAAALVDGANPKPRAYTLLAELLLLQHSCHWFCKSRTVASARLLARHRTSYAHVLQSLPAQTRQEYLALVQAGAAPTA